ERRLSAHITALRALGRTVDLLVDQLGHRCSRVGDLGPRTGRSPMNSNTSVAMVPIDRCFADGEELALAGFLAGYRGSTREAYALDLRQSRCGARTMRAACSRCTASTSSALGRTWRPEGGLEQPSPVGCARLQASTATPRRKP